MTNLRKELFGGRILRGPQDVAAADACHAPRAGDEQEAEGPHAAPQVGVGAFAGARLGGREGVELEVAGHVVGQDAELLPRAVGAVVVRGDDIQGELALELGNILHPYETRGAKIPRRLRRWVPPMFLWHCAPAPTPGWQTTRRSRRGPLASSLLPDCCLLSPCSGTEVRRDGALTPAVDPWRRAGGSAVDVCGRLSVPERGGT